MTQIDYNLELFRVVIEIDYQLYKYIIALVFCNMG